MTLLLHLSTVLVQISAFASAFIDVLKFHSHYVLVKSYVPKYLLLTNSDKSESV